MQASIFTKHILVSDKTEGNTMKLDTSSATPPVPHIPSVGAIVYDDDGIKATVQSLQHTDDEITIWAATSEGQHVVFPLALVECRNDGLYLPIRFNELVSSTGNDSSTHKVPVWTETLQVEKRLVDTGKGVRIEKKVRERNEDVSLSLLEDELEVQEVPVQKIVSVDEMPCARQDGDTYIIPVFKEVLVVEKRVCLEKEIHITKRKKRVNASQSFSLKSEEVSVKAFDEGKVDPH